MIQIRKATIDDAQHIALLARITFTETFSEYFSNKQDLFNYYEQTFSVPKIRTSIMRENNQFWVAYWNELPIGYAKLKKYSTTEFIEEGNSSQLQKIYVLKDFLDKGIGKLLMNELMIFFHESNVTNLWLSVLKSNERAVNFYYRNDFKHIGELTFQIGSEVFDYYVLGYEKNSPH